MVRMEVNFDIYHLYIIPTLVIMSCLSNRIIFVNRVPDHDAHRDAIAAVRSQRVGHAEGQSYNDAQGQRAHRAG